MNTNTGLVAVGMVILLLALLFVLVFTSGYERWVLGGLIIIGLIGIILRRTGQAPVLPTPAGQDYLIEVLKRGYFYGDSSKLIHLHDIQKLGSPEQVPPALLPKPNNTSEEKPK